MVVTFYCPICGADISQHATATLSEHWAEWKKASEQKRSSPDTVECTAERPRKSFWFGYGRPDV
jgi:hypothetical protein